jgi:hypothetical protein
VRAQRQRGEESEVRRKASAPDAAADDLLPFT